MADNPNYFRIQRDLIQVIADIAYKGDTRLAGFDYCAKYAQEFNQSWLQFPEHRDEMKEIFRKRIILEHQK